MLIIEIKLFSDFCIETKCEEIWRPGKGESLIGSSFDLETIQRSALLHSHSAQFLKLFYPFEGFKLFKMGWLITRTVLQL